MRTRIILLLLIVLHMPARGQEFYPPAGGAIEDSTGVYNLTPGYLYGLLFPATAVWSKMGIDFNAGFEIRFRAAMDIVGGRGADGFCLVFGEKIQPASTNGYGGFLGYYNKQQKRYKNPDFLNSFALEIDHYPNGFEMNDPIPHYDHLMVTKNGHYYNVLPGGGPAPLFPDGDSAETGEYHQYKIIWDCADSSFKVFLDDDLRLQATVDYRNIFIKPDNIRWGFTGGAGGSYSNHYVRDISYVKNNICITEDNFVVYPGEYGAYNYKGATVSNAQITITKSGNWYMKRPKPLCSSAYKAA